MTTTSFIGRFGKSLSADARLLLSFFLIAAAAIIAGGTGLLSFERIEEKFEQVAEQRVPALADALFLVEQAAAVNALTFSFSATSDALEYDRTRERAEVHRRKVLQILESLSDQGVDPQTVSNVEELSGDLFNALKDLEVLVGDRLALAVKRRTEVAEAGRHHQALNAWLAPRIDDANFDLVIQTEDATRILGDQLGMLVKQGVGRLNSFVQLRAHVDEISILMAEAAIAPDLQTLETLEGSFTATHDKMKQILERLGQRQPSRTIEAQITSLTMFGNGDENVFSKRRAALEGVTSNGHILETSRPNQMATTIERHRASVLEELEASIIEARHDLIELSERTVEGSSTTINGLIDQSVARLTSYLSIASESNWIAGLLRHAAAERDAATLGPLVEEIETAGLHLADLRSTLDLVDEPISDLDRHLDPILARAIGESSLVALRRSELAVQERLERIVALTHDLSLVFTNEINILLDETRTDVAFNNASVKGAITQGRWILLALLLTVLTIAASIVFRERMYRDKLEKSANELRLHYDHLQELVDERTKTISDQARELRDALDAEKKLTGLQRQFVSMVCHEFRTPLAIIDANAQRIIRRHENIAPERQKSGLWKIRTAVIRLTDLMESVLSAARLEAGSISYEPAPCDLRSMIHEVSSNQMEVNPSHQILVDVSELPESYVADVKLIRQVISNLLSNAVKYSPEGERVWVSGKVTEEGDILIDVRDEGVGIPKDEVDKLFDRFFRASTSIGIAGTGIGLHLVKTLVDLHSGKVNVESTVGVGTVFSIILPGTAGSKMSLKDCEAAA